MSAFRALDAARAAGIDIQVDGKNLKLMATSEPPAGILDMLRQNKRSIVGVLRPTQAWDPSDWQAYFGERAGIAEFDGGLSGPDAEARAFDACLVEWLLRNPIDSTPEACLECGKPEGIDGQLLPIGIAGAGQAWLHRDCVAAWHAARIVAAVKALKVMNISLNISSAPRFLTRPPLP